jgi:hypothetical protein
LLPTGNPSYPIQRLQKRNASFSSTMMVGYTNNRIRKLLEQAFKIYNRGAFYAPELARTQYMTGVVLSLMNNHHGCGAAFAKAWEIRKRLVPGDLRSAMDLQEADYDELVVFWAR